MPNPTCPTNCDSNLPAWLFSNCAPVVKSSEIRRLFFAKVGAAPFTDWLDASEWLQRLDQSSTTSDDLIRAIDVIGDLPAGSQVIKEISLRRKITVTKDRTLNFTIDDVSQVNYDAARVLECNAQYKFWFETEGGRMFGGNDGEIGNIDINSILARGADSTEELQGVITWRNKFMPESGISPIFNSNTTPVTVPEDTATITYGYQPTDPFVNSSTAPTISNSATKSITHNANYTFNLPSAAADNYWIVKEPITEPLKTSWYHNTDNSGSIPGDVVRVWTVGSFRYYASISEFVLTYTDSIQLLQ